MVGSGGRKRSNRLHRVMKWIKSRGLDGPSLGKGCVMSDSRVFDF